MVTIIDYGVGNLVSIRNMLKKIGVQDVTISNDADKIQTADKLILPGVGNFDYGMKQLKKSGLSDSLNFKVINKKTPILGICLGAQLLTQKSEEGSELGLGWINAVTQKFKINQSTSNLKVPHMGWSEIKILKKSPLLEGMPINSRFYFVHTYHIVCEDQNDELLSCNYEYPFTAAIERNNIIGVQFHPEKSHKFGMLLLRNFINNY